MPKITKTRLLIIHKGGTKSSPMFDNCSGLKMARKANITNEVSDNKPDNQLGKRFVRKYPTPVMVIPKYIMDQPVQAIASPIESDSALNFALFIASETSPILKPTTIISNPASMKVFLTKFLVIIKDSGIVTNA